MKTFQLNKLVKDLIVPKSEDIGITVDYTYLEGEEAILELFTKIGEEYKELQKESDTENRIKELIDIQLVIETIIKNLNIPPELFQTLIDKRKEELGGFDKLTYVHTMEMSEDNPRCEYYKKDPEKFPEISE